MGGDIFYGLPPGAHPLSARPLGSCGSPSCLLHVSPSRRRLPGPAPTIAGEQAVPRERGAHDPVNKTRFKAHSPKRKTASTAWGAAVATVLRSAICQLPAAARSSSQLVPKKTLWVPRTNAPCAFEVSFRGRDVVREHVLICAQS